MTTSCSETESLVPAGADILDSRHRADHDGENEDRRTSQDRRTGGSRRKAYRRRQIDPTTCERDYSRDEIDFMRALDTYKRENGRMFPTCSEILEVIRSLGYVRIGPDNSDV